jgi:hypothetical protein
MDGFEVQPDVFRSEPGKTLQDFLKRPDTWMRRSGGAAAGREAVDR